MPANHSLDDSLPRARRAPETSRLRLVSIAVGVALVVAACGGADDGETESTQDLLEELEGRPLSPAEVAERTEVFDLLCGLDDDVLVAVWSELSPADFEFQDIVFTSACPERLPLYAEETGRFVVDDNENNDDDDNDDETDG